MATSKADDESELMSKREYLDVLARLQSDSLANVARALRDARHAKPELVIWDECRHVTAAQWARESELDETDMA